MTLELTLWIKWPFDKTTLWTKWRMKWSSQSNEPPNQSINSISRSTNQLINQLICQSISKSFKSWQEQQLLLAFSPVIWQKRFAKCLWKTPRKTQPRIKVVTKIIHFKNWQKLSKCFKLESNPSVECHCSFNFYDILLSHAAKLFFITKGSVDS